jgi:hypothetical protein
MRWHIRFLKFGLAAIALVIVAMAAVELLVWASGGSFIAGVFPYAVALVGTGLLASALIYALCLIPLTSLWRRGAAARVLGAGLTALLLVGVSAGPYMAGRNAALAAVAALKSGDHMPASANPPTTLEIRSRSWSMLLASADSEGCVRECQQLLRSGQAIWVRLVLTPFPLKPQATVTALYRALRGEACAAPGFSPAPGAVCVVEAPDSGEPAEVTLSFESLSPTITKGHISIFADIVSAARATASRRILGHDDEILRETAVETAAPTFPTYFHPLMLVFYPRGLLARHTVSWSQPLNLASVLGQLGYAESLFASHPDAPIVDPYRKDPPGLELTRQLIAVLDLPGAAPFAAPENRVVAEWSRLAGHIEDWTPERIAVLRRVILDRRVRLWYFDSEAFVRFPELATALLPDVVEELENDRTGRLLAPSRGLAASFGRIDPAILRPYSDRVIHLIERGSEFKGLLLPAVGQLGVDPAPYLTPILADISERDFYSQSARATGACRAEKRWAGQLIEPLRHAYRELQGDEDGRSAYRGLLLKSLVNLGDRAFVDHELANMSQIDAERLKEEIRLALGKANPDDGLYEMRTSLAPRGISSGSRDASATQMQ